MTRNLCLENKVSFSSSDLRPGRQTVGGGTNMFGETMTQPPKMKVCITRGREVHISVQIEDSGEGAYCTTMEGMEKTGRGSSEGPHQCKHQ